MIDEEEKKKRLERAKQIASSINSNNYSSNFNNIALYNIQGKTEDEKNYISRFQRAREITNSINPRDNVPAPSITEEEQKKSRENAIAFINLMDRNNEQNIEENMQNNDNNKVQNVSNTNKVISKEKQQEIAEKLKGVATQGVSINPQKSTKTSSTLQMGLATQEQINNAKEINVEYFNNSLENAENKNYLSYVFDKVKVGFSSFFDGIKNLYLTDIQRNNKNAAELSEKLGDTTAKEKVAKANSNIRELYNSSTDAKRNALNEAGKAMPTGIQVLGEVGEVVGNQIPSLAISMVDPNLGLAAMGLSAAGSAEKEAIQEGATEEQAQTVGILKGSVEVLTEKLFGGIKFFGKGTFDDFFNDKIMSKITSNLGSKIAQELYDVGGEITEEYISNIAGYGIDKIVLNKELPSIEKALEDAKETTVITALSTLVLQALGLGINGVNKISSNNEIDLKEDKNAQDIVASASKAIKKNYYVLDNSSINNEEFQLYKAPGTEIELVNKDLNISPVIVQIDNRYDVIDKNTGLVLDNSFYTDVDIAKNSFNAKISNIDNISVQNINDKVRKAKLAISNKMNEISNYMVETENASKTTNSTLDDVNKLTSQISNDGMYTAEQTNNIMDFVSSNIKNIHMIEQSGNMYLNSLDKNGNLVYQQNIPSKNYTGAEIKEIINNAVQNADMSNETMNMNGIQANVGQDTDNFNIESLNYTNKQLNTDNTNTTKQMEEKKSMIKSIEDIKSKYKENVDVLNISESENNNTISLDNLVIKKEQRNKGIGTNVINDLISYANQKGKTITLTPTNEYGTKNKLKKFYKSFGFVDNKGKNTDFMISDTMYKKADLKAQLNVEGNELRNMKKNNSEKLKNVKYNHLNEFSDKRRESINKLSNSVIATNSDDLKKYVLESFENTNSKKDIYIGIIPKETIENIKENLTQIKKENVNNIFKDNAEYAVKINQDEIRHINKKESITIDDVLNFVNSLDEVLTQFDLVSYGKYNNQNALRFEKNMNDGNHIAFTVISNQKQTIRIQSLFWDRADYKNKRRSIQLTPDDTKSPSRTSKTDSLSTSFINNSISQKNKNVKNNTAINKQSMQKEENNTSNDDIRYMKSNSNTTKSTNATNKNTKNTRKDDIVKSVDTQIYQNNLLNIDNNVAKTNAEGADRWIEKEIQKVEQTNSWDNTIPVTKRSDIRKTIEDYLGLNIKKGHFRQKAYGIYNPTRDVIRVKEYKDMDNILHEAGHAMDLGNRLKIDKESIANELFTAIDKHGGYEKESRTVRLDEGFAEVIREYTIVPEQAKKDYPQSIAVLEGIRKQDQSFDNFIKKVQQQTYNYIHQNPRNRTLSNMSVGERTDKRKWSKEWISQEVMRNIYDKDYALKKTVSDLQEVNGKTFSQLKASDNAYYLTRLSSGIGNKIISMLSDGYIDENGNQLMPGLNKIGEILGNNLERFNDLRAYLVAQRDLEYKAKTLKTGIRTMDSKAVVNQFKNDAQIQEAAKLIYDTIDGVMQYAVNNGLITEEQALSLKNSNAFYVPMQRVLEGNKNNVGRRGAVTDIIKKRTGSELDVKDILENIITNSSNIIQQVENNNILRALYKQGEASGLTGAVYDVISTPMTKIGTTKLSTWKKELKNQGVNTNKLDLEKTIDLFAPDNKVDSKNLITSFIDETGKRVYLQFNDDVLFNSIMNMDKEFMSKVLKINRKLNMPLRYGATMANIGFTIPNMISDTAQAAIYSTAGFVPVIDNALGVMDILSATNPSIRSFVNKFAPGYADKINRLYTLYQQTGATSATRLSQYRESSQNVMKDVYGTKKSENLGIQEKYKPLKRLLDLMTYIPEISEQSTRFRVFEKNYDYYKNKGNSEMDARIMAALESRDATQDFGRMGNFTREINQLIPFSAARVGSAYTFAEKVKANPKQVGMRIAVLTAIAMTIKAIGYDDDEIDELNQRKKDDNFVLKIGDQVVTVKKPQGILRSMINLSEYIQDLATGHIEEGKEGERLGEWLNNAIMDNMPADSITGLVPNMVAPLIENAINKDFYYNTDIVKSYDLDLPDKDQYYDYNSQLAIWLGQAFNYSPAKIDNLISGYFGGLGTQVTGIIDYISGKVGLSPEKPEMGAETDAVGKRFIVNVNTNSASIDEIYKLETELTKKQNGGTITSEEEKQLETIKSAINNMSKVNKQIKEIKKDLTMSGEEKAEKIKELQKQKTDTARQALGKDLIYPENEQKIESSQFYPSQNSLKNNGYILNMSSEQKKEYEQLASEYYSKYEKQGLYNEEKLKDIKSKAKEYAKSYMMQKYRTDLIKTK